MIAQTTIREAIRLLLQAAPGSRVILFGSYARGDAKPDSDLDFLVIEPEIAKSKREEMVRLRDALRPLRVPADVLVTSRRTFDEWRYTPNNVFYEAAIEGMIFDEMA